MTKDRKIHGQYFCGNKISDYGLENGHVDYSTLAKSFNAILNNDIYSKLIDLFDFECWDLVNGDDGVYDEESDEWNYPEVFQFYIIDDNGAEILKYWTDELVWYNEEMDIYIWGVTHYGTSWTHVLTDIKIDNE